MQTFTVWLKVSLNQLRIVNLCVFHKASNPLNRSDICSSRKKIAKDWSMLQNDWVFFISPSGKFVYVTLEIVNRRKYECFHAIWGNIRHHHHRSMSCYKFQWKFFPFKSWIVELHFKFIFHHFLPLQSCVTIIGDGKRWKTPSKLLLGKH